MTRLARDDEQHYTRRDVAEAAGFDPHPDDLLPPAAHLMAAPGVEPLSAFAACVEAARHVNTCQPCADTLRCDVCHDRMCDEFGPEPRACGTTCGDCPCDCTGCIDARNDLRAELQRQLEKDAD